MIRATIVSSRPMGKAFRVTLDIDQQDVPLFHATTNPEFDVGIVEIGARPKAAPLPLKKPSLPPTPLEEAIGRAQDYQPQPPQQLAANTEPTTVAAPAPQSKREPDVSLDAAPAAQDDPLELPAFLDRRNEPPKETAAPVKSGSPFRRG